MIGEIASGLALFTAGFSVAVVIFYDSIRIGVQLKREARKKAKEGNTVANA